MFSLRSSSLSTTRSRGFAIVEILVFIIIVGIIGFSVVLLLFSPSRSKLPVDSNNLLPFEITPTPSPETPQDTNSWKAFTNAEYGIYLFHPEYWIQQPGNVNTLVSWKTSNVSDNEGTSFTIRIPKFIELDLEAFVDSQIKENNFGNKESCFISGLAGFWIESSNTNSRYYYVSYKNTLYEFTYKLGDTITTTEKNEIEHVVNSIQIIPDSPSRRNESNVNASGVYQHIGLFQNEYYLRLEEKWYISQAKSDKKSTTVTTIFDRFFEPKYTIPHLHQFNNKSSYLTFAIDEDSMEYAAITYPTNSAFEQLLILLKRKSENDFEIVTTITKESRELQNQFPIINSISGGIVSITLSDCIHCAPTENNQISINIEDYTNISTQE